MNKPKGKPRLENSYNLESSQNSSKIEYNSKSRGPSYKVMVAFGPRTYEILEQEAKQRYVTIQEVLRAVIIPEWFRDNRGINMKGEVRKK